MSRQAIFCLMQSSARRYLILDWQSFMMTRKHTSPHVLLEQCVDPA
ncbi:hypothetical protein V6Z11_A07G136600 [Gossypium hirsutum]